MRTPVIATIVASLIVGGCVTKSVMKVGSAREEPTGYREVLLSGTTLQLRYKTMAHVSGLGSTTPSETVPRVCAGTRSTPEPAPAMTLHQYEKPFKSWYSPDAPDYEAPVAAYVEHGNHEVLVLIRASSSDGKRVVTSLHAVRWCDYDLPWAPYARAALVPFAVAADILTSPFQALYLRTRVAPGH